METVITVLITVGLICLAAVSFLFGHRRGHRAGLQEGYDQACDELLLFKDPEAWDKARALKIERRSRQDTTRIVRSPTG